MNAIKTRYRSISLCCFVRCDSIFSILHSIRSCNIIFYSCLKYLLEVDNLLKLIQVISISGILIDSHAFDTFLQCLIFSLLHQGLIVCNVRVYFVKWLAKMILSSFLSSLKKEKGFLSCLIPSY